MNNFINAFERDISFQITL